MSKQWNRNKQYEITILWGEQGVSKLTYSFSTLGELKAFCLGIEEANGWFDYEIIEEGDEDE